MHKGIYRDNITNTWYIKTKKRGRNITIRGYQSKKEADSDYEFAIEKWFRTHHFFQFSNTPMFKDVAKDYLDYVRNDKAGRTADREKTQIKTYWGIIFANDCIASIYDFERLKLLYRNLKNDEKLNVRKKHDLVYTFLEFTNYCYYQKLIDKETLEETTIIFQTIKYTKKVENARRIAQKSEIKALLEVIKDNESDYFMFLTLISCGLRISELLGLCGDCFVDNKLIVKRQLLVNGKLSDKLKTQQSYRSIPMTKELQDLAKKYVKPNNKRVFKISHTNFKRVLYAYEAKAKIPQYVPHEFRHSFCFYKAQMCENVADVSYISKICGHSTSVFLNTYCSHLDSSLENKFFG